MNRGEHLMKCLYIAAASQMFMFIKVDRGEYIKFSTTIFTFENTCSIINLIIKLYSLYYEYMYDWSIRKPFRGH
jgi:hypothetical protein